MHARQLVRPHAARSRNRNRPRHRRRTPTEDSFGRILSDVRDELGERLSGARKHPSVRRVSDLIDGLEDLASKLDR